MKHPEGRRLVGAGLGCLKTTPRYSVGEAPLGAVALLLYIGYSMVKTGRDKWKIYLWLLLNKTARSWMIIVQLPLDYCLRHL
jgi:hypothetical protein